MRARVYTLVALLAASLVLVSLARGQSPVGIVRPASERGLGLRELGSQLFAGNCSTCHGIAGRGVYPPNAQQGTGNVRGLGPPLVGVGAQATDFYLRTGYMPLERADEQPSRHRVLFTEHEIRALVAYVASLHGGPPIPHPVPSAGRLSEGLQVFTQNCAGCHQVVAQGGVVTGAKVPSLTPATATQIAEAVRIGPYLMPQFSAKQISPRELDSLIAYVKRSQHPDDRGGWGIGNIGPVPEGMVTWLIAAVALVATCMAIGERAKR